LYKIIIIIIIILIIIIIIIIIITNIFVMTSFRVYGREKYFVRKVFRFKPLILLKGISMTMNTLEVERAVI